MILTGKKITSETQLGNIVIEPFDESQVNPNSYNYRLNDKILCPVILNDKLVRFEEFDISDQGFWLEPHVTYLSSTYETLGSCKYAMSLIGRSSVGRLGLFLQVSANLGHTGSCHRWTLELVCAKRFKIHKYMKIGQICFWHNLGTPDLYKEGYSSYNLPQISNHMLEKDTI